MTGLVQTLFLSYDADFSGPLVPLVLLGTIVCTGLLVLAQAHKSEFLANHRLHIIAIAIGILFIAPLVWLVYTYYEWEWWYDPNRRAAEQRATGRRGLDSDRR